MVAVVIVATAVAINTTIVVANTEAIDVASVAIIVVNSIAHHAQQTVLQVIAVESRDINNDLKFIRKQTCAAHRCESNRFANGVL